MIETAILTIHGERYLFQAVEPLAHCPSCDLWLRSDQSCPHIAADAGCNHAERQSTAKAPPPLSRCGTPGGGSNGTYAFDAAPGSVPFHHASEVASV